MSPAHDISLPDFGEIRVIGFDLDQTLYPKSPEIDSAIQDYLYDKIASFKNCTREEAKRLFDAHYRGGAGMSGSKTLETLGIPGAKDIVQEALEQADIERFLVPDEHTRALLERLRSVFGSLDLITGSNKKNTAKKLSRLDIPQQIFSHIITQDEGSKSEGTAFRLWLSYYPSSAPHQFLYIGDRQLDFTLSRAHGIQAILVNIAQPDVHLACLQLASLEQLGSVLL